MQYWVRRDPLKDKVRNVTKEIKEKKSGILKILSCRFDPIDMTYLATLEQKLILQKLWEKKTVWDYINPKHVSDRWTKWKKIFTVLKSNKKKME